MRSGPRYRTRSCAVLGVLVLAGTLPSTATAQDQALREPLERFFEGTTRGSGDWSVLIRSLDRDDTLFSVRPDSALAPASNMKLLTTAAALHVLGPEYRFRTYLMTDGVVEHGVVSGDLVLFGTGDPGISDRLHSSKTEVYHRLIDQLESAGIHAVRGDLVGDASFFPGPLRSEGWDPRDLNDHFAGAVSALSFNENVVSFRVVPRAAGAPPSVYTIPDRSGMTVLVNALTVVGRARPRLAILRDHPLDPVRVEGRITAGTRDVWREMTVPVPAHFAASTFRAALEQRGITVLGETRIVTAPALSAVRRLSAPTSGRRGVRVLARHVSDPLPLYLEVVNKQSNNLFAELVFRAIGRVASGEGTPEASALAIREALQDLGVDIDRVVQMDGSGLDGRNRVSATTFVDVLDAMAGGPFWPHYWASLPEAGRRRELGRMYGTAAAGNLRAKTGTIERVSALSGVVRTADGERLAFSLLVNGIRSTNRAKWVENQVGIRLASFRRGTEEALPIQVAVVPAPAPPRLDGPGRHRVSSGESLTAIANRYGLTLEELLSANPRVEPNRIFAGQWVEIPMRQSGSGGY